MKYRPGRLKSLKDKSVFVIFTMDCERITEFSPSGGPKSWDISEHSIKSYGGFLNKAGYKATFFAVPSVVENQAEILERMKSRGNEIGLHFHWCSYGQNYKENMKKPLGCMPYERQKLFIEESISVFVEKMGWAPKVFRPGFFSVNDDTLKVLIESGFIGGSISLPGRNSKNYCAYWRNTRRDVHPVGFRGGGPGLKESDPINKVFIEVPATSAVNRRGLLKSHGDIRFERYNSGNYLKYAANAIIQHLGWQLKMDSPVLHLLFFTHNLFNYDPDPAMRKAAGNKSMRDFSDNLNHLLDFLNGLSEKYDFNLKPTTIEELIGFYSQNIGDNLISR